MTVRSLQDLVDAHAAALRNAEPPAAVVILPGLLQQLRREDAADGGERFTPDGRGGCNFMGLPVSVDPECPSAVVFSADQAARWRKARAEQAYKRMFPAWDT